MRFIVIVAMYNMERWIADNIRALLNQSHDDFVCYIGDDLSTDNSVNIARKTINNDRRFTLIEHQQKK